MVPSWTETLIECGANVVGRTRFCIHPRSEIPIVGGTKNMNWEKVHELKPDLMILDQDENPKAMAEQAGCRVVATHVTSIADMPSSLELLSCAVETVAVQSALQAQKLRWEKVLAAKALARSDLQELPGVLQWWMQPTGAETHLCYIIWRDPWMRAERDTFIGSVIEKLGYGAWLGSQPIEDRTPQQRYPPLDLRDLDPQKTVLLFSSEPFPFAKKRDEVANLGFACALVDGESYSWFGIRSLRFLESLLAPI